MNGKQIGIKLADGSFYPILEEDFTGRKKLVVTTSRDNQESVQIDLFRGKGERADQASFLGSLMIENIHPAPKKEPEIELLLGLDPQGNLEASASDALSGEMQSLSLNLQSLAVEEETPFEEAAAAASPSAEGKDFEESLLTGETYPIGPANRRKEHIERRKRSPLLLVLFIVLGLAIIAGAAYLVYRLLDGKPIPALLGGRQTPPVATEEPAPPAEPEAPEQAQPAAEEKPPAATSPAQPPAEEAGIWYRIKWGDTLWDLAATYYRNPWLYPKLAKANDILNPDLIIAGSKLFIPKQ